MTNILVSACLLGLECRYDGKDCLNEKVKELKRYATLIPVCPEQMGGLSTPRVPSEIVGDRLLSKEGADVTENYDKGARMALEIAKLNDCKYAVLKQKSPSCGCGLIYDGTFSGKLIAGNGNTTKLLNENGIICFSDEDVDSLLNILVDKSTI